MAKRKPTKKQLERLEHFLEEEQGRDTKDVIDPTSTRPYGLLEVPKTDEDRAETQRELERVRRLKRDADE